MHETQTKAAGYVWQNPSILPVNSSWAALTGGAIQYQNLSDIGGNVRLTQMQNFADPPAPAPPVADNVQAKLELRIHGIQCRGIVKNNSTVPARVEIRLLYIPNLNAYTVAPIDYLVPRFTMFYKSGQGTGNILFNGYNRRALAALDATGVPVKFTTLDRKVIHLPPATVYGTVTMAQATETIMLSTPAVYRRFSLSKYFKTPRRAFARASQNELSDGNYFLVYWSDLATVGMTCSILADSLLQYSIKAPMHEDEP